MKSLFHQNWLGAQRPKAQSGLVDARRATMSYLARGPILMGIDSKANGMRCRRLTGRIVLKCRRQQA
ncbi:MAG: hypothetical protein PSV26_01840 [Polaromonas sp.]|uniref:hypothetical protein n=1 Tax=Polaromonas sp. TaxID=1869339 RepID=UPI00248873A2|nr:hypothetical protein [Polaromonas sp.]MDI1236207.1 hypothetical protein [Polaromonas sp.]